MTPPDPRTDEQLLALAGEVKALSKAIRLLENAQNWHDQERAALREARRLHRRKKAELKRFVQSVQMRLI